MQMCIIYELAPERAVEMPGAASDEARLNLTGNAKAEEWCGRWRPATVRNACRLTVIHRNQAVFTPIEPYYTVIPPPPVIQG